MTDEDKEKARILNIPISKKLTSVLEQLSIVTSEKSEEEDKPKN